MGALHKYLSFSKASLQIMLVYKSSLALNLIGTVFYVVAMFYLWQTIFLNQKGALPGNFTWQDMKAYILISFLLNSVLTWYDEWVMGKDIREGLVAVDLTRPVDFQLKRLADAVGPIPIELTSALVVAIVVATLFGGISIPPDPLHAGLFLISAVLATITKFALIYCVSMLAFWTTGVTGISWARLAIQSIFSGALIPLVFFPGWLQTVAAILPFQGLISTPALTYLGKMDGPTTATMLAIQAGWAIGLLMLGRLTWRRASRAVTINGG
jgi:ABC-2 type transport system permease protein